jgi:hypothetical protein
MQAAFVSWSRHERKSMQDVFVLADYLLAGTVLHDICIPSVAASETTLVPTNDEDGKSFGNSFDAISCMLPSLFNNAGHADV